MPASGKKAKYSIRADVVCCAPNNGHEATAPACPSCATSGHWLHCGVLTKLTRAPAWLPSKHWLRCGPGPLPLRWLRIPRRSFGNTPTRNTRQLIAIRDYAGTFGSRRPVHAFSTASPLVSASRRAVPASSRRERASAAPDLPPPWISASVAACPSGLSCFDLDNAANDAAGQRAPFNMHDVEQVTVFPWSHLMQAATH
jgi:hypothetical protein